VSEGSRIRELDPLRPQSKPEAVESRVASRPLEALMPSAYAHAKSV
jgi:hypothetical protein